MEKIKYIVFCPLLLMLIFFSSCKKLVEVGVPTDALATSSVFSNDQTAITAQLAVYADMASQLYNFDIETGLSADEQINYSTQTPFYIDLYRNNLNAPNDGGLDGYWSVVYTYIYEENSILENVQSSTGMSEKVKQLMAGEAQFMRAFNYFALVNLFGDVPLVTSTDYKKNSVLPRTPQDQVYRQMVIDLQSSLGLLSPDNLDANDNTAGVTDRVRPTTWAANALLARVYLYMGKYDSAEQQASLVIANTSRFSLPGDLSQVFKMNSQEAIWQLMPAVGNLYAYEGTAFVLTAPPGGYGPQQISSLSPQLLGAFEPNDNRHTAWVNSYSQNGTTWYYPYKYHDGYSSTSLSEYTMVLRLAEQYLIRAEARLQNSDPTGAVADLNVIRHRAGLPDYSGPTDKQSLLAAIAHERQVELFTENDRWFDLKRTKAVDSIMSVVTPQKQGGVWNSYQQLYPLFPNDLTYNPYLVQNPGY